MLCPPVNKVMDDRTKKDRIVQGAVFVLSHAGRTLWRAPTIGQLLWMLSIMCV